MKWQFSLFLVCLFTASNGQEDSTLVQSFLNSNYSWHSDKTHIPKFFFQGYKRLAKEDFLITDDERDFNATDMVIKGVPDKKLVYCGTDTSQKKGFVYFLQGGIIISKYLLIFDVSKKRKPKITWLQLPGNPNSLEELKQLLKGMRGSYSLGQVYLRSEFYN